MSLELIDIYITQLLHSPDCKVNLLSKILLFITKNSQYIWFFIFTALFLVPFNKKKKPELLYFLACFSGFIISWHFCDEYLKPFFSRERPFDFLDQYCVIGHKSSSSSFPSGHTVTAFTGGFLAFFFKRKKNLLIACLALLFSLVCAYTRIFIGVHYFFDVLGGIFFALIISFTWYKLIILAGKDYKRESH